MSHKKIDQFVYITRKNFQVYLAISILVFLFVLFFQPFAIEKFEFENKLLFFAGFGLIILIFLFLNQILFQNLFLQLEREQPNDSLLFSLYFISLTVTTSLAFIFYIRFVGEEQVTFNLVVKIVFICIAIPVTIHLNNRLSCYQHRLKDLMHENNSLQIKLRQFSESYASKSVELISENDADNFRILVSKIAFVRSADNYVEIGYQDGSEVKKKMIRNTLKGVENQLREFNNFIRTHRTSLVNVQYIKKFNKNFNTYWLSLDKTDETIPVSRQYLMSVKGLL
jgi:hypothetical protein